MNLKIKLIVGFRRDQEHSIDASEAHKAYYLFLHPEQRGIFNNGLAIKGDQIQEILPDYHGTMGWYSTHVLDSDDMAEIRQKGVDTKIRDLLALGKDIAQRGDVSALNTPLTLLPKSEPQKQISAEMQKLYEGKKV